MPVSTEAFRQAIGSFYLTLIRILCRKGFPKSKNRPADRRTKCAACSFKCELFSWLCGVSLSLTYCLFILMLTQCMDVETNPGPTNTEVASSIQRLQQSMDLRLSQVMHCLFFNSKCLHDKLDHHFEQFEASLRQLHDEVTCLSSKVRENTNSINFLQSSHDQSMHRLEQLERDVERMETASRQANLKFIGIPEDNQDGISSVDKIVNLLNSYSSDPNWKHSDIDKAYRIGRMSYNRNSPRPLVVGFRLSEDKLFILRDRHLRDSLRWLGIKIASDLTPRQQAELKHYRDQGLVAFFKNGHIQVENHNHGTDERCWGTRSRTSSSSNGAERDQDRQDSSIGEHQSQSDHQGARRAAYPIPDTVHGHDHERQSRQPTEDHNSRQRGWSQPSLSQQSHQSFYTYPGGPTVPWSCPPPHLGFPQWPGDSGPFDSGSWFPLPHNTGVIPPFSSTSTSPIPISPTSLPNLPPHGSSTLLPTQDRHHTERTGQGYGQRGVESSSAEAISTDCNTARAANTRETVDIQSHLDVHGDAVGEGNEDTHPDDHRTDDAIEAQVFQDAAEEGAENNAFQDAVGTQETVSAERHDTDRAELGSRQEDSSLPAARDPPPIVPATDVPGSLPTGNHTRVADNGVSGLSPVQQQENTDTPTAQAGDLGQAAGGVATQHRLPNNPSLNTSSVSPVNQDLLSEEGGIHAQQQQQDATPLPAHSATSPNNSDSAAGDDGMQELDKNRLCAEDMSEWPSLKAGAGDGGAKPKRSSLGSTQQSAPSRTVSAGRRSSLTAPSQAAASTTEKGGRRTKAGSAAATGDPDARAKPTTRQSTLTASGTLRSRSNSTMK